MNIKGSKRDVAQIVGKDSVALVMRNTIGNITVVSSDVPLIIEFNELETSLIKNLLLGVTGENLSVKSFSQPFGE